MHLKKTNIKSTGQNKELLTNQFSSPCLYVTQLCTIVCNCVPGALLLYSYKLSKELTQNKTFVERSKLFSSHIALPWHAHWQMEHLPFHYVRRLYGRKWQFTGRYPNFMVLIHNFSLLQIYIYDNWIIQGPYFWK